MLKKYLQRRDGKYIIFCENVEQLKRCERLVQEWFKDIGEVKVFDLVNNFGNHNAIDAVFMEFKEEMQRKIKENPENAEKYKEKLNRFKIMDETRIVLPYELFMSLKKRNQIVIVDSTIL